MRYKGNIIGKAIKKNVGVLVRQDSIEIINNAILWHHSIKVVDPT